MRQPTFARSRRRTRQQRLLRTAIGVVVIVVVAALIANLVGSKKKTTAIQPGVPHVVVASTIAAQNDIKTKPSLSAAKTEGDQIVALLTDWYQRSFVDPSLFGDGTFPDITRHFSADAKTAFMKDLSTMTIGEAREEVKRVDPSHLDTKVTIFFNKTTPTIAVAACHFVATATLKASGSYPLTIDQTVTFTFQKTGQGWVVSYYTAKQSQKSVLPSPSATPTAS